MTSLALFALTAIAAGCRGSSSAAKTYTTINWADSGAISGVIHVTGGVPKPVSIDMSQDPVCALSPENTASQYAVNNGALANVLVYVQSGLGRTAYAPPSTPAVIDEKNCRFIPHVTAVMAGQPIEFTDSDNTMHDVRIEPSVAANQPVNIMESPDNATATRVFAAPELMMSVRCGNHPWMQAYVSVLANPFYAVSDSRGRFTIQGLPPGTYTVQADQEALGSQTATVTVVANRSSRLDFTYRMPRRVQ